jgi:hypothetical protein
VGGYDRKFVVFFEVKVAPATLCGHRSISRYSFVEVKEVIVVILYFCGHEEVL